MTLSKIENKVHNPNPNFLTFQVLDSHATRNCNVPIANLFRLIPRNTKRILSAHLRASPNLNPPTPH